MPVAPAAIMGVGGRLRKIKKDRHGKQWASHFGRFEWGCKVQGRCKTAICAHLASFPAGEKGAEDT